MQKLLLAAAVSLAALALPATPATAQGRADALVATGANVQLAQRGDHRRFHRDGRRDHRAWHRGAGPRRDWDRGDFRGQRRFHREDFRDHRRFHRDAFRGHRRFDRRFDFDDRRFRRHRGFGFGSGFGFGHGFGFGFGSGFGTSVHFGRACRSWWWDGWAWRCRW